MIFFNSLEQFGDKTALILESGDEVSYQKLTADADEIASKIGCRTLVFCVCSNNVESVAGYIGFLRDRIVPILINPEIDKELFINLRNTYQPEYIWAPSGFTDDEVVYKLIGPVLIQQDTGDCKIQIDSRLDMIKKEITKLEKTYKENEIKMDNKRKRLQEIQNILLQMSKQVKQKAGQK